MKRCVWIAVGCSFVAVLCHLVWRTPQPPRSASAWPNLTQLDSVPPGIGAPRTNSASGISLPPGRTSADALRPILAAAMGQAQERDFRTRLRAISQLGSRLSRGEREVLYQHLRDPLEDKWLRPGQGLALKNDILNALCEQEETPPELVQFLISLWRDTAQPIPMRDYALQHFAPLFSKAGEQQALILRELQAAARETGESYAGTALLTWARIWQENPASGAPLMAGEIRQTIEDPAASLLTRIAAVQLSGELNLREVSSLVNRIALDKTEQNTLRLAAVAALNRFGSGDRVVTLQRIREEGDERLAMAAVTALQRLGQTTP
jgi:hypothetical protein